MVRSPLPRPLVSADWLADHLAGVPAAPGDLVIADVRWYLDGRSGRAAYEAGHLPGAVFVDLDADLAGPPSTPGGRHPLPSPERFAEAMGALGIGDGTAVVAYDDTGGMTASRLWWMLDALGEHAAVLDGGMGQWARPLETGPPPATAPSTFSPRPWPPERFLDAAGVAGAISRPGVVVLDARSPERFRGEPNPVDERFGHVPGARNLPWAANLGAEGRFLDPEELTAVQAASGVAVADEVVVYCGSGVSACATLLGLRLTGGDEHAALRLYSGSWSDWAADPARPVATGPS